jgi:predicted DNA-binding transcriptional regulator AlpA
VATITIESKAFKRIMDKLTFIEQTLKVMSANSSRSKWMMEDEVMALTRLSKRSLFDKRKKGEFEFSTATGRKIKYLRKDIDAYLNNNSTAN